MGRIHAQTPSSQWWPLAAFSILAAQKIAVAISRAAIFICVDRTRDPTGKFGQESTILLVASILENMSLTTLARSLSASLRLSIPTTGTASLISPYRSSTGCRHFAYYIPKCQATFSIPPQTCSQQVCSWGHEQKRRFLRKALFSVLVTPRGIEPRFPA